MSHSWNQSVCRLLRLSSFTCNLHLHFRVFLCLDSSFLLSIEYSSAVCVQRFMTYIYFCFWSHLLWHIWMWIITGKTNWLFPMDPTFATVSGSEADFCFQSIWPPLYHFCREKCCDHVRCPLLAMYIDWQWFLSIWKLCILREKVSYCVQNGWPVTSRWMLAWWSQ